MIIMKIGVISDIHGYLEPLQSALALFDHHKVDQIICAGDLADGGDDGEAVVELLRARDILCVQGNHDRDAFVDQAWLRRNLRAAGETTSTALLNSETVAYLSGLPLALHFVWEGVSACIAHGTPTSNTTYLFPESPQERWDEALSQTDADVVILGHTHVPMAVQKGQRWVLNPGSVARNRFADTRTCAILTLPDVHFSVYTI